MRCGGGLHRVRLSKGRQSTINVFNNNVKAEPNDQWTLATRKQ